MDRKQPKVAAKAPAKPLGKENVENKNRRTQPLMKGMRTQVVPLTSKTALNVQKPTSRPEAKKADVEAAVQASAAAPEEPPKLERQNTITLDDGEAALTNDQDHQDESQQEKSELAKVRGASKVTRQQVSEKPGFVHGVKRNSYGKITKVKHVNRRETFGVSVASSSNPSNRRATLSGLTNAAKPKKKEVRQTLSSQLRLECLLEKKMGLTKGALKKGRPAAPSVQVNKVAPNPRPPPAKVLPKPGRVTLSTLHRQGQKKLAADLEHKHEVRRQGLGICAGKATPRVNSVQNLTVGQPSPVLLNFLGAQEKAFGEANAGEVKCKIVAHTPKHVVFHIQVDSGVKGGTPRTKEKLKQYLDRKGATPKEFRHLACFGCKSSDFSPARAMQKEESEETDDSFVLKRQEKSLGTPPSILLDQDEGSPELKKSERAAAQVSPVWESLGKLELGGGDMEGRLEGVKETPPEDEMGFWQAKAQKKQLEGEYSQAFDFWLEALGKATQVAQIKDIRQAIITCKENMLATCSEKEKEPVLMENIPEEEEEEEQGVHRCHRREVDPLNIISSSTVKYAVRKSTFLRSEKELSPREQFSQLVVTPVRRSTRKCRPANLVSTPGMPCVTSLKSLPKEVRKNAVYFPNPALPQDD